jgi:hypothetical protein|tara:strand:+ start:1660 stop:1890 length:231 start_codon:yes stop_codon:yes gene_type:complete
MIGFPLQFSAYFQLYGQKKVIDAVIEITKMNQKTKQYRDIWNLEASMNDHENNCIVTINKHHDNIPLFKKNNDDKV